MIGSETSSPGDGSARNKPAEIIFVNGYLKGKSVSGMWPTSLEAKVDTVIQEVLV